MNRKALWIQMIASLAAAILIAIVTIIVVTDHLGPTSSAEREVEEERLEQIEEAREEELDRIEDLRDR